jgi:hypothetical protein
MNHLLAIKEFAMSDVAFDGLTVAELKARFNEEFEWQVVKCVIATLSKNSSGDWNVELFKELPFDLVKPYSETKAEEDDSRNDEENWYAAIDSIMPQIEKIVTIASENALVMRELMAETIAPQNDTQTSTAGEPKNSEEIVIVHMEAQTESLLPPAREQEPVLVPVEVRTKRVFSFAPVWPIAGAAIVSVAYCLASYNGLQVPSMLANAILVVVAGGVFIGLLLAIATGFSKSVTVSSAQKPRTALR